ncbi:PREDICTED: cuticle protein 70, isoforms A and B [Polistes canadensis]|uniref:cuticle protein 70, isoforms A and B n=1 Tax=Polistes canadensis TaxID=91411 RepID=UPI000718BEBC|nr:PREDICTED: cuticle protein 70, isoforms A and B [Polistes canadensis]
MYKFAVLIALIGCVASAPAPAPGYLTSVHAAPLVASAPVVTIPHTLPVATSYSNTYKVSVKSPLIATAPAVVAAAPAVVAAAPAAVVTRTAPITYTAPIVKTAPVLAAAPAVVAHPAAITYAAGYVH